MNNLRHYTFVCEFKIKLGNHLNQNHLDFLNNTQESDSSDAGKFSVGQCEIDGSDTLTGRYYLKSEIIPDSEQDYLETMKRDLILLIRRDLKFQMDGALEFTQTTVLDAVILAELSLRHNGNEGEKVYYSHRKDMFYVLNSDGYCDGAYENEVEAVNSLTN